MSINPRRTVLLICDVQDRFRGAIHAFDAMSSNIQKMIRAAQILDMRVLTTEQNPKALGGTIQELGIDKLPQHLNMGVFPKSKFSMMTPEVLRTLGGKWAESVGGPAGTGNTEEVERVIIVGIESHVCVTQTILDSIPLSKYKPIVVADAVSSCNAAEVPIALDRLARAGAEPHGRADEEVAPSSWETRRTPASRSLQTSSRSTRTARPRRSTSSSRLRCKRACIQRLELKHIQQLSSVEDNRGVTKTKYAYALYA